MFYIYVSSFRLFGKKDRAKVTIKINGDEMKMTDDEGTATLTKIK